MIKRNQKGLASIVVVAVLVVLLSLISIGFARLMNRAVNNALNNQLSTAANYGVQSGINEAVAYITKNPSATATHCSGGDSDSQAVLNNVNNPNDKTRINPQFSGDSSYKYTCILINPRVPDLEYANLPPSQSQVAKLNPTDANGNPRQAGSLLISWQGDGSDQNKTSLSCTAPQLYQESDWASNNCPPLLRMTLYPVTTDPSTNLQKIDQANDRTFFLYPSQGGSNSFSYNDPDGSIETVKCKAATIPDFSNLDSYCNVELNNLPAADYFYTRVTPLYDTAAFSIKAVGTSRQPLEFSGDQVQIDVTAQAGVATKRVQAHVPTVGSTDITPGELALPEDGLRSADAICKQLDVSSSTVINQAPTACNGVVIQQPQPMVVKTLAADNLGTTTATLHGTVTPNSINMTSCKYEYGTTTSYGLTVPCPDQSLSGTTATQEAASISGLNAGTTYHFQLVATDSAGNTVKGGDLTFTTTSAAPPSCSGITLYQDINYGGVSDTYTTDQPNFFSANVGNDVASSIKVPANCAVTLYNDINYGGACVIYTADQANFFGQAVGNDAASSLKMGAQTCGNSPGGGGGGGGGGSPVVLGFNTGSSGGNDFQYLVNNVNFCQVFVDNPPGGEQDLNNPTQDSWDIVTAGNPPSNGSINCYQSDGTPAANNGLQAQPPRGGGTGGGGGGGGNGCNEDAGATDGPDPWGNTLAPCGSSSGTDPFSGQEMTCYNEGQAEPDGSSQGYGDKGFIACNYF